jgi:hypothetical protein
VLLVAGFVVETLSGRPPVPMPWGLSRVILMLATDA